MKFPHNVPFHVYANCIPVKGNKRSIIYDLHRSDFDYIPNALFQILQESNDKTFSDLQDELSSDEDKLVLQEYFEFLYEKEYIFFSTLHSKYFPELILEQPKPYNFSCLISDIETMDAHLLGNLKTEITNSRVECVIFRFKTADYASLHEIASFFNDLPVRTIEIYFDSNSPIHERHINELIAINKRISIIVRYNSFNNVQNLIYGKIVDTRKNVMNGENKIGSIADFDVNIDLFVESGIANNYFNKRVYIDPKGDIYRFENDTLPFGNIKETSLLPLLKNDAFKEFWPVRKDDIYICSQCEYKYMCVDNRKPVRKNENNLWELDGQCNYDPSIAKWKN